MTVRNGYKVLEKAGDRMLNEKRIRLMTELARYEKKTGKEDLRIAGYYRSDYLGKGLLGNFFLSSIGYLLLLCLIAAYYAEFLLNSIHLMNLKFLAVCVIGGYVVTVVVYSVIRYIMLSLRYSRAKRSLKLYDEKLAALEKMYEKEEKRRTRKHN